MPFFPIVCFLQQSSPSSPEPASLPAEDITTSSNGPKAAEIIVDDDREDLFAGNFHQSSYNIH